MPTDDKINQEADSRRSSDRPLAGLTAAEAKEVRDESSEQKFQDQAASAAHEETVGGEQQPAQSFDHRTRRAVLTYDEKREEARAGILERIAAAESEMVELGDARQQTLAMIADQNPGNPAVAAWKRARRELEIHDGTTC